MALPSDAYTTGVSGLTVRALQGFFRPVDPALPARHLEVLCASDRVVLAREGEEGRVVGFVTSISDGVLSAFIALLEVLPEHRGRGIGTELVRRLLVELERSSVVDVVCDPELVSFYRRFEMTPLSSMGLRRHHPVRP